MKFFWLLLVLPAALADNGARLCPDGYYYAGEDTPPGALNKSGFALEDRDVWYEEVDRSLLYSCYKAMGEKMTFLKAMHRCWDDDAQLVSTEDNFENIRIWNLFYRDSTRDKKNALFTSGMYMYDIEEWQWLGSENEFRSDLTVYDNIHGPGGPGILTTHRDCLTLTPNGRGFRLSAVPCGMEHEFICEARVQTVTYYAWFRGNWIDLLLGLLLVILFISLCVSLCSISSSGSASRGQAQRRGANPRRPRTTDPNSEFTLSDLPPSYDTTVNIHQPIDQDKNQLPAKSAINGPVGNTRMEHIQNRGRELMGKLYVYRK